MRLCVAKVKKSMVCEAHPKTLRLHNALDSSKLRPTYLDHFTRRNKIRGPAKAHAPQPSVRTEPPSEIYSLADSSVALQRVVFRTAVQLK
jgi:hypothetical protein